VKKQMKNQVLVAFTFIILFTMFSGNMSNASPQTSITLQSNGVVQQISIGTYSYVISVSGSNYQMIDGHTSSILYQNPNATKVFNFVIANCSVNNSIFVESGTYNLNGSICANGKSSITMVFDAGAVLYVANHMNAPAILLNSVYPWSANNYPNNWVIVNGTINGNANNQVPQGNPFAFETQESGIVIGGNNDRIENMSIYNCRLYGIDSWGISGTYVNNCTLYNCGSNSITLGGSNESIINCNTYGSSDVGISLYGDHTLVQNNYVHDLNGTTGTGGNAIYGIATEGASASYAIIVNNTINNCIAGMYLSQGNELVKNNTVTNCHQGIVSNAGGYDVITQNTISYWGHAGGYPAGIILQNVVNDIVSFNTLINNLPDSDMGSAIFLISSSNCSIGNNTVTVPLTGTYSGFGVYAFSSGNNYNLIEGNNIQASIGIKIQSSCLDNKLSQNMLSNCTTPILDSGTGTIINSPSTYTLTICNPFDGSAEGTHVYSSGVQITLACSAGFNVNGLSETSPQTLTMNRDYFVYALGNSLELTNSPSG
jgi:hypothetical protein